MLHLLLRCHDHVFTCTAKPDDVTPVDHVLRFTSVCLCCAPRGRSEEEKGAEPGEEVKIVAVDLQAMAPLPGVTQIQGDITKVAGRRVCPPERHVLCDTSCDPALVFFPPGVHR